MMRGRETFLKNPHKGDKRGILPSPIVFYPKTFDWWGGGAE